MSKIIYMGIVCLFLFESVVWGLPQASSSRNAALAVATELSDREFKEKFKALEFLLAHDAVNEYIKSRIENDKKILGDEWEIRRTFKVDLNDASFRGNIKDNVEGIGSATVIGVDGLLSHTGQFAHVGLSGKDYDGTPAIYVDRQLFNDRDNAVLRHEIDEILQWENLRVNILHIEDRADMRRWIREHVNSPDERLNETEFAGKNAREISRLFHERSYPLRLLYKIYGEKEYFSYEYLDLMLSLYGSDEESGDVNIAAHDEKRGGAARSSSPYSQYLRQFERVEITHGQFNELRAFVDDWYFDRVLDLEADMRPIIGDAAIFSVKNVDLALNHPGRADIISDAKADEYRRELHLLDFVRRMDLGANGMLLGILFRAYEVRMRELGNREQQFNRIDLDKLIKNWHILINTYIEYHTFLSVSDEFSRGGAIKGRLMEVEQEVVRRLTAIRERGDPYVIDEDRAMTAAQKGQRRPARYYRWIGGTMPLEIQMVIDPRNTRTSDVTREELRSLVRESVIVLYGGTRDELQKVMNITVKDIGEELKQKLLLHRVDLRRIVIEAFPDLVIDRYSIGQPRRLARWMFNAKDSERWDSPIDQLRALEALVEFFNPAYKDRKEKLVEKGAIERSELPAEEMLISQPGQLTLKHLIRSHNAKAPIRPYIPGVDALYANIFSRDMRRMIDDTFGPGTYAYHGSHEYRRRFLNEMLDTLRADGEARSPLDLRADQHFPFTAALGNASFAHSGVGDGSLTDAMSEIWGGIPLRLLGEERYAYEETFKPFMVRSRKMKESILNRADAVRALAAKHEEREGVNLTKTDLLKVFTAGYLYSANNEMGRSISAAVLNAANYCDKERLSEDASLQDEDKIQIGTVHGGLPGRIELFIEAALIGEEDYDLLREYIVMNHRPGAEPIKFSEDAYKKYVRYARNRYWKEWLAQKDAPIRLSDTANMKLQTKEKVTTRLEEYRVALRIRMIIDSKRIDDLPRPYKHREIILGDDGVPIAIAFHGLYTPFYRDFSYFNVGESIAIGHPDGRVMEWAKFRIEGLYDDTVRVSIENIEVDRRKALEAAIPKAGILKIIPDPDTTIEVQVRVLGELIERIGKDGVTGNKAIDQILGLSVPRQVTFEDIEHWISVLRDNGILSDPRILEDPAQVAALAATLVSGNVVTYVSGPPGNGKSTILSERAVLAVKDKRTIWNAAVTHSAVDNLMENIADAARRRFGPIALYRAARSPDLIRREDIRGCWLSGAGDNPDSGEGAIFGSTIIGAKTLISMRRRSFPLISIDEASTVTFPQLLAALTSLDTSGGRANVLIVGDDNQLPPFPINPTSVGLFIKMSVRPKVAKRMQEIFRGDKEIPADLKDILREEFTYLDSNETSFLCSRAKYAPDPALWLTEHIIRRAHNYYNQLFNTGVSRLMMDGPFPHISLSKNYRSHWALRELYSRLFYNGQVRSRHYGPMEEDTYVIRDTSKMADEDTRKESNAGDGSYTNEYEADLAAKEIVRVLSLGDEISAQGRYSLRDIVVVTPYQSQAAAIRRAVRRYLSNKGDTLGVSAREIERFINWNVSTIDSFQGSQSKVVICSFTRSNRFPYNVGFLSEFRRINVTISRVQEKLILIGDFNTLTQARRKQDDAAARNMFSVMRGYASEVEKWLTVPFAEDGIDSRPPSPPILPESLPLRSILRRTDVSSSGWRPEKYGRKGSPARLLMILTNHPDLLERARTIGFTLKEITDVRKADDGVTYTTSYGEFDELRDRGVLVEAENYHKQRNPRYRLADDFIARDGPETANLINVLIENGIPKSDSVPAVSGGREGPEGYPGKGLPVRFLATLIRHSELLERARGAGFSVKEAAPFREEDGDVSEATVFGEVKRLCDKGVLARAENYNVRRNPRYRLADSFIGEDELDAIRIINELIGAGKGSLAGLLNESNTLFVKETIRNAVGVEDALYLTDSLSSAADEKRCYVIRYNDARLRDYALGLGADAGLFKKLLEEYALLLRLRLGEEERVDLKPSSGAKQPLISVESYGGYSKTESALIGAGHVDIEGEGLDENSMLRMVDMLNMAFAASNIPNNVPQEELGKYSRLILFIQDRYREITAKELSLDQLLHRGRLIILPNTRPIPSEKLKEYYEFTIKQLRQAA